MPKLACRDPQNKHIRVFTNREFLFIRSNLSVSLSRSKIKRISLVKLNFFSPFEPFLKNRTVRTNKKYGYER